VEEVVGSLVYYYNFNALLISDNNLKVNIVYIDKFSGTGPEKI
jgi:hypothetical protein